MQKQPPEVFYKKGVLKNFAKFTGKHLYQSPFINGSSFLHIELTFASGNIPNANTFLTNAVTVSKTKSHALK